MPNATRPPRPAGRTRHDRYLLRYRDHRYADTPIRSLVVREHDLINIGAGRHHIRAEHLVTESLGCYQAVPDAYALSLVAFGGAS